MTGQRKDSNQVVTFGCRLNSYESEAIKLALKTAQNKNPQLDNLVVFNSCAVTNEAERQLRQAIRKAAKENPQAKIVVTGCASQINPKKYADMTEVSLVLGNTNKTDPASYERLAQNELSNGHDALVAVSMDPATQRGDIGEMVRRDEEGRISDGNEYYDKGVLHQDRIFFAQNQFITDDAKILVNDIMSIRETAPHLVSHFENKTRAFLEIQNGCNHRCTFCIIPYGRGNSRSVPFGRIVEQVKAMIDLGHKEIVFTGVDISDYGKDLDVPITLAQMIRRLFKLVPQLPRLRLSSIDVAEIDDEMLDIIANESRFMPYLHLSVQSGDDMILKRMKRRHDRNMILEFCAKARQLRSDITFGSDIIAGFPTETDEMFENSVKLISEAGLIFNHIFPYSKKAGTPAAKMPQLNGKIIKERAKILRQAGDLELKKYLKTQIGKTLEVLIEKDGIGKSKNFFDVQISQMINAKIGDIITVTISGADLEKNILLT